MSQNLTGTDTFTCHSLSTCARRMENLHNLQKRPNVAWYRHLTALLNKPPQHHHTPRAPKTHHTKLPPLPICPFAYQPISRTTPTQAIHTSDLSSLALPNPTHWHPLTTISGRSDQLPVIGMQVSLEKAHVTMSTCMLTFALPSLRVVASKR